MTDTINPDAKETYQKISESMLIQLLELCRARDKGDVPRYSPSESLSIRLSWNSFLAGGPAQRGIDMFLRMFRDYPETQGLFTFPNTVTSSTMQMQSSSRLLFHVTRVIKSQTIYLTPATVACGTTMGKFNPNVNVKDSANAQYRKHNARYIGRVVDNLENLEDVVPMLKKLGGRHGEHGYNVPTHYFPYLGQAMRDLMKETLPNFPESTAQAWRSLFDGFIVKQIVQGHIQHSEN